MADPKLQHVVDQFAGPFIENGGTAEIADAIAATLVGFAQAIADDPAAPDSWSTVMVQGFMLRHAEAYRLLAAALDP
jgi:hypothetical protein